MKYRYQYITCVLFIVCVIVQHRFQDAIHNKQLQKYSSLNPFHKLVDLLNQPSQVIFTFNTWLAFDAYTYWHFTTTRDFLAIDAMGSTRAYELWLNSLPPCVPLPQKYLLKAKRTWYDDWPDEPAVAAEDSVATSTTLLDSSMATMASLYGMDAGKRGWTCLKLQWVLVMFY